MKSMFVVLVLFVGSLVLSGCSAIRYNLGSRAGIKEYERMKKTGVVKNSYGVGYVAAMTLMKAIDDLEETSKRLSDAVKEFEKIEEGSK